MVGKVAVDRSEHFGFPTNCHSTKCSSFSSVIWLVQCAMYGLSTKGLSLISPQELKKESLLSIFEDLYGINCLLLLMDAYQKGN
jgi:hypothetical protein